MKDDNKKDILIELEEKKNRELINAMFALLITAVVFYIGILWFACYILTDETLLGIVICFSTVVFLAACFYALKIEYTTGYYECKKCHNRYVPKSYFTVLFAPHLHTTRLLKCPKCNETTWSKKVITKETI